MNNKDTILKELIKQGYKLGCWDNKINKVSKKELKRIVDSLGYGSCDIHLIINKKDFVAEVNEVDGEYDFSLVSRKEYENRYGIIEDEDWRF